MNVNFKVFSTGVAFFLAASVSAQTDSTKMADIEEVVVVGYGRITWLQHLPF